LLTRSPAKSSAFVADLDKHPRVRSSSPTWIHRQELGPRRRPGDFLESSVLVADSDLWAVQTCFKPTRPLLFPSPTG
jgi:hypothetical protein